MPIWHFTWTELQTVNVSTTSHHPLFQSTVYIFAILIMPAASKKLEGHIASGLFVLPSVHLFVTLFDA